MKTRLLAAVATLCLGLPAFAHDYQSGGLKIEHPAIPQPLTRAMTAGGFFTVKNEGPEADRLIGVEADIARKVEVHTTEHGADGSAKMVHVPEVEIPAGGELRLERGSYHVMFMGLSKGLEVGTKVPATLIFEKAGRVEVEFAIEEPAAPAAKAKGDHSHH